MMPVLHSYLTVDTDSFLARPDRVTILLDIAVAALDDPSMEEPVHAAKLLECLILQCQVYLVFCYLVILMMRWWK